MKWFKKHNTAGHDPARWKTACLRALSLPEDVAEGQARVVLCGSSRALVENTAGVAELREDIVRLRLRRGELAIYGNQLSLQEARKDAVCVEGCICRIELDGDRP